MVTNPAKMLHCERDFKARAWHRSTSRIMSFRWSSMRRCTCGRSIFRTSSRACSSVSGSASGFTERWGLAGSISLLPLAGDKTAGLPFCTAEPPEGRAPWMARVNVPKADEGLLRFHDKTSLTPALSRKRERGNCTLSARPYVFDASRASSRFMHCSCLIRIASGNRSARKSTNARTLGNNPRRLG